MNINSPKDRLVGSFGIVGGNDRRCHRCRPRPQARRRRRRLPVRRRGDQPGVLLRMPQLLCGDAAAGRLSLREQRLRRVHAVPGCDRGRDLAPSEGDGGSRRDRGRDERRRRRAAAGRAVAARARRGPYFLEAVTYRYVGHSRSDPGAYRPAGELDAWKERDPIPRLRGELVDAGVDPKTVDAIDREIETLLEEMDAQRPRGPVPGAPADARSSAGDAERPADAAPLDSMSEATIVGVVEAARRAVRPRRAAGRGRDRQGDGRLRGRGGRGAGGDPGVRGRHRIARRSDRPARGRGRRGTHLRRRARPGTQTTDPDR